MGCAFSFLTSCVQSRTSKLVPNVNAIGNDENVDTQQNESKNCIRTQGSVCFSGSDVQIHIRDSSIFLIDDNNEIDFRQPRKSRRISIVSQ